MYYVLCIVNKLVSKYSFTKYFCIDNLLVFTKYIIVFQKNIRHVDGYSYNIIITPTR